MSVYSLVPRFAVRWMARRALTAESGFWAAVGRAVERHRGPGWRDDLRLGLQLHEAERNQESHA